MAESNGYYKTVRVILYAVVSQNGLALKFPSEKLKGDPESMSEVLKQDGFALEYDANVLKSTQSKRFRKTDQGQSLLMQAHSLLKNTRLDTKSPKVQSAIDRLKNYGRKP